MPSPRFSRVLAIVLTLLAVGFALSVAREHWASVRAAAADTTVRWAPLGLSVLLVFVAYAVLIQTWRRMLAAWDGSLSWADAAYIWFVSNLGRYLPGKVWQIAAMGVLAQRAGVSAQGAVGSSLVIALVNILAGLGVITLAGRNALSVLQLSTADLLLSATLVVAATVLLPWYLPRVVSAVNRVFSRSIAVPRVPFVAIIEAAIGCALAWVAYGVAFYLMTTAIAVVPASATLGDHIAVFALSYLAGYLALFAPGGIGVREVTMAALLTAWLSYDAGTAGLIVIVSRAWLTVLEMLPGLFLLSASAVNKGIPRPR